MYVKCVPTYCTYFTYHGKNNNLRRWYVSYYFFFLNMLQFKFFAITTNLSSAKFLRLRKLLTNSCQNYHKIIVISDETTQNIFFIIVLLVSKIEKISPQIKLLNPMKKNPFFF